MNRIPFPDSVMTIFQWPLNCPATFLTSVFGSTSIQTMKLGWDLSTDSMKILMQKFAGSTRVIRLWLDLSLITISLWEAATFGWDFVFGDFRILNSFYSLLPTASWTRTCLNSRLLSPLDLTFCIRSRKAQACLE